MLLIVGSHTRYVSVHFLRNKNETYRCMLDYRALMEKQSGHLLKRVHSDGGGEFDNNRFRDWCTANGIAFTTNAPYSSSSNGLAERFIGTIINDARAILHESGLHPSFWAQAAAHAAYIRNRIPRPDGSTPHELMFKTKPRTDHLRVFGCAAIKWIPESHREFGKLNDRGMVTIFLGYVSGTSNVRLYDPETETFTVSRDVRYLENVMPAKGDRPHDIEFLKMKGDSGSLQASETSMGDHDEHPCEDEVPGIEHPEQGEQDQREHHRGNSRPPARTPVAHRTRARLRSASSISQSSDETVDEHEDGTVIRDQPNLNDSDTSEDEMAILSCPDDPKSVQQALANEDAVDWTKAIEKEMTSIESFGTHYMTSLKFQKAVVLLEVDSFFMSSWILRVDRSIVSKRASAQKDLLNVPESNTPIHSPRLDIDNLSDNSYLSLHQRTLW